MTVAFDADTGRLRLDNPEFSSLVAWASGDRAADVAALQEAGVVQPDAPHPAVAAGLAAVIAPVCRLHLTVTDDAGRDEAGEGWIAAESAALLLDLPEGLREFVTVRPDFVPAAVARIVELGPRSRPGINMLALPREAFDGLLSPDPARRSQAASTLTTNDRRVPVVDGLVGGGWRVWQAVMTWTDPDGDTAGRALYVLDTAAGLCLADVQDAETVLWPTTATGIWRRLIELFPDNDELKLD